MKSTQSKFNPGQYLLTAFLVVPMLSAMQFGKAYTSDSGMQVLYSGLAGGVGGGIGIASYYFTSKLSLTWRIAALLVLAVVTALPTILLPPLTKSVSTDGVSYSTCPVCGYIAYRPVDQSCDNCGIELTNEEMHESGVPTLDSLIKLEQALYFVPENEKSAVNFNQPAISEDGYSLDKSWRPSVSNATVEAEAHMYYEIKRKYPIKVKVIKKD